MISSIFNTIFYEPLLNGLIWLINILPFHNIGIAVVILTILVRLIIFPFTHRATVTQVKMKQLEPELKEIKEKFKKDNQEQAKKIMELYKQHGINPLSGFITLLIQIPIIIALYKVFLTGLKFDSSHLYSFISPPDSVNIKFLGFFDMTQKSYILAGLASFSQFFQMKMAVPIVKKIQGAARSFKDDFARSMSIQARYIMPLFIFFIALKFASAIALYWTTMNIFAIVHEAIVRKKAEKILKNGTANKNNQITFRNDSGKINH